MGIGLLLFANLTVTADVQVIDSETLSVDGRTVRLWGIETPAPYRPA